MADLKWRGPKVMAIIRQGAQESVVESGIVVQAKAKRLLNRPGTGRRYVKRKPRARIHIASSPGNPPAKDLGNLGRSVQVDISRLKDGDPRVSVGTNVRYGRILETIARRPWLSRALEESEAEINRRTASVMRIVLASIR